MAFAGRLRMSLRRRDPCFRQRILKAYEYRCAVCGFDVRLGSISIALDAAHIRTAEDHWAIQADEAILADASRSEFWTAVNYNVINRLCPEVATERQ